MEEVQGLLARFKIISGGQTGVDRGALDAAIRLSLPHGGWCPRNRRAEDGRIPDRYQLQETDSRRYSVRTEKNVLASDATLILCRGPILGGTELTNQLAKQHKRPCLVVDLDDPPSAQEVNEWIASNVQSALNVAGPRESTHPGIAGQASDFLDKLLCRRDESPPR